MTMTDHPEWTDPDPTTAIERPTDPWKIPKAIGRWSAGILLWTFQYSFAVWMYAGWRLLVATFKLFGWGALLLFVPIIGWIFLWLRLRSNRQYREHRELVSAVTGEPYERTNWKAMFRPWCKAWVTGR